MRTMLAFAGQLEWGCLLQYTPLQGPTHLSSTPGLGWGGSLQWGALQKAGMSCVA